MAKLVRRGLLVAGLLVFVAIAWTVGADARPVAAGGGSRSVVRSAGPLQAGLAGALGVRRQTSSRSTARLHAGQAEAFRVWTQTSGVADVVHIHIDLGSTARTLIVGVYSNADGHPGLLLSSGSEPYPRAHVWGQVPIAPVRLRAGRTYWLAVLGENGRLRHRNRRHEPCLSDLSVRTRLHELPRRWGTGRMRARGDCPIAAYLLADSVRFLTPSTIGSTASPAQRSPSVSSPAAALPSPEVPSPPPPAPADSVGPAISGPVIVGEQLGASPGTWTDSPTSYAYQWEICNALGEGCLSVSEATSSSYTLTPSDLDSTVRVAVTASNAGGSTEATSSPAGPVVPAAPTIEASPAIGGTAEAGETLSSSPGTWTGSPTAYAYQWEDCNSAGEECDEVSGATSSTYALTASDVGRTVVVVVTASNAGGATQAGSSPTAAVAAEQTAPTNEVAPSISGSTLVGEKLTASPGKWTGHPTLPFAYQWEDCDAEGGGCSEIAGAKSQTYTLPASEVGHTIRVVVTASNASGPTPASSEATAVVVAQAPAAPANTALPAISGSAVEGQTLSASHGTWSGSPTSYGYQWEDCNAAGGGCVEIAGATSATRKLASGDVGHTLRVVLMATNAGGTGKATSAATATVDPPAPGNTALPTIGGSDVEGETLSAGRGTWTESPTSYAYQWEVCNTAGEACANVNGATASSYVLGSSDVGHTLKVVVTASNAGGHSEATSAATKVVTAKEKVKEEKAKEGTPKDCFENPETEGTARIEACGYPGPKDTGVAEASGKTECSALPKSASGDKTITKAETIEDTDITGQVTIAAAGVKLNKDCIVYDGHEINGSSAVILDGGASDFTIANTTVRAENDAADSFEEAISNDSNAAGASASKDRLEDCGECLHQEWALTDSYVIANGQRGTEETDKGEVHREDWYCNDNTITAEDNTMLNPYDQTAVIFCDTNLGGGGACSDHLTATGNLLAGSGYMLYPCGNSSSVGTSTMTVKDNRFARCLGSTKYESGTGGTACADGADANGYWPYGGYFGAATSYYTGAGQVWEGNYWDDDLATVEP